MLVLVRVLVLLPPHHWTVVRIVFFHSILDKQVFRARILTSLGYGLVESSDATMILYFSVAFWMRSPYRYFSHVYQSSFDLSMKQLEV